MCDLNQDKNSQVWTVWIATIFLLFGPSIVRGVLISPCGIGGVREVLADQDTVFTCTAEGRVEWRLQVDGTDSSELLATCDDTCHETENINKLLIASVAEARRSSFMTIRPVNHSDAANLLNGSLHCVLAGTVRAASSRCELSFVYPPEGVSCIAVNTTWSVTVSCDIGSVYSSRRLYTCQLYAFKDGSNNETLETVPMVTLPATNRRLQVSGSCQFKIKLPVEEGHYGFFVAISPSGWTYDVIFNASYKWISIDKPHTPTMSCGPDPYVLENTNITCVCSTTSLGQPEGYLRWIIGNHTKEGTVFVQEQLANRSQDLSYTHHLTLSDHEKTWFRCDVIWGGKEIHGKNYTASVGYVARTTKYLFNDLKQNLKVTEGDHVHVLCKSDGRPTPTVSIYNTDNDTVIRRDSSVINYTFFARCEDTATYMCSARNEFSSQPGVTPSPSLGLDVLCKPRGRLSKHLGEYNVYRSTKVTFDLVAYPVPHKYHVWLVRSSINTSESTLNDVEVSMINITCKSSTVYNYLSTCILTIVNMTSVLTESYKVQVINEAGEENFTLVIHYAVHEDLKSFNPAVPGGVVSAIIFTFIIVVLISVKRKRKRSKVPLRICTLEADGSPGNAEPEPCQTALYAAVDKKKKKTNSHITKTVQKGEEVEKMNELEPRLPRVSEDVYAAVDKTRNKPGKCDNVNKLYKYKSFDPEKGRWKENQLTDDSKHTSNDCGEYQNVVHPLTAQNEDANMWDARSPASRSHTVDDGRWLNSAGLLYTFPTFDHRRDVRCPPPPTHDETEYCTIHMFGNKFLAHIGDSKD